MGLYNTSPILTSPEQHSDCTIHFGIISDIQESMVRISPFPFPCQCVVYCLCWGGHAAISLCSSSFCRWHDASDGKENPIKYHTTYMLDVMPLPLGCCSKSVVVFGSKSSKLFYSSTQLQVRWWQLIRYVVGRTCSHVDRFRFEIASQRAQIFEGSNEEPLAIDLPEEP